MATLTIHMGGMPEPAYYVAPTGNDTTGDGSFGSPWATIGKWVGVVGEDDAPLPGSTLYLRGGTYSNHAITYVGRHDSGVDTNDLLGTAGSPITIRNYPGETPVFSGGSSNQGLITLSTATYVIIDGLHIVDRPILQTGWINTGQWPSAGPWGPADNITIRNCYFNMGTGDGDSGSHPIYVTAGSHDVVVEDNVCIGPGNGTPGDGGFGVQVYEGFRDAPVDTIVQRNIIDGWNQGGITIYGGSEDPNPTGSILHNTFVNCTTNIRLGPHDAVTVRDNAGEDGSTTNINDDEPGNTTASYNFWDQAFDASYFLLADETGRNAASDGIDAGALDW